MGYSQWGCKEPDIMEHVSPQVETAAGTCVLCSIWTQEGTRGSYLRPSWADPAGNLFPSLVLQGLGSEKNTVCSSFVVSGDLETVLQFSVH